MLLFDNFTQAGVIQIKDVCYEFILGFLTTDAVVEIIQHSLPYERPGTIKSAYEKILHCISDE